MSEELAIREVEGTVVKPDMGLVLTPVMNISVAKQRLAEFQEFVQGYLKEGEDFGTIPGTPKPTLYKPGADKLCELYGLADTYKIEKTEDFHADPPLFDYTVECSLWRGERLVSTGWGSCNSYESKYKLRDQQRTCPSCGKATIIRGKEEWGGGWVCWKKAKPEPGCGAKFGDGDPAIEGQPVGRIFNDDIPTLKNTILKMAKKRAKIDATLAATRSSGVFTQDIEDIHPQEPEPRGSKVAAQEVGKQIIREKAEAMAARGTKLTLGFTPGAAGMTYLVGDTAVAALKGYLSTEEGALVIWLPRAMKHAIPNDQVEKFFGLCEKAGIEPKIVPAAPGTAAAPSVAVPSKTALESQLEASIPTIRSTERGETKKHQVYLKVRYGTADATSTLNCFKSDLFPYLEAGVGKPASLIVQKVKDYQNIMGIESIGNQTFSLNQDEKYVPDIQADEPPLITDEDLPAEMFPA